MKIEMGLFSKLFGGKKESSSELNHEVNLYSKSIDVFFDNHKEPDTIQLQIANLVKDEEKATLIWLFAPYYFCKMIFPEVQWTDYYHIQDDLGNKTVKYFRDSVVLRELDAYVQKHFKMYEKRGLEPILAFSADFKGIYQMVSKGSKLEDLQAVPPLVMSAGPIPESEDVAVLNKFKTELEKHGFAVERHPEYHSLIVNGELEIAAKVIENPNNHPQLLQLMVLVIHQAYFPEGIEEHLVGMGASLSDRVDMAVTSYLQTIFSPIVNSMGDLHHEELDFKTVLNGNEVLWHPQLSAVILQGEWEAEPEEGVLYERLKDKVKSKLTDRKLNWLKVYISKQEGGAIHGECRLNNEPWAEGLSIVEEYAKSWELPGQFKGMKQFVVFKKCDVSELSVNK